MQGIGSRRENYLKYDNRLDLWDPATKMTIKLGDCKHRVSGSPSKSIVNIMVEELAHSPCVILIFYSDLLGACRGHFQ